MCAMILRYSAIYAFFKEFQGAGSVERVGAEFINNSANSEFGGLKLWNHYLIRVLLGLELEAL